MRIFTFIHRHTHFSESHSLTHTHTNAHMFTHLFSRGPRRAALAHITLEQKEGASNPEHTQLEGLGRELSQPEIDKGPLVIPPPYLRPYLGARLACGPWLSSVSTGALHREKLRKKNQVTEVSGGRERAPHPGSFLQPSPMVQPDTGPVLSCPLMTSLARLHSAWFPTPTPCGAAIIYSLTGVPRSPSSPGCPALPWKASQTREKVGVALCFMRHMCT